MGYYSFFKHNEFNDTLRYVIFISVPLITFFLLFIVLKKDQCLNFKKIFINPAIKMPKRNFYLNFILLFLIIILTIKFFIGDFPDFKLDAFHEGQLLSGAYNFYITNLVFWRPPGNRTPNSQEIKTCISSTKEHINIIKPKLLIFLGNVAAKSLL